MPRLGTCPASDRSRDSTERSHARQDAAERYPLGSVDGRGGLYRNRTPKKHEDGASADDPVAASPLPSPVPRLRHLAPLLGVAVVADALWLIGHQLRDYKLFDIEAALRALPTWRIAVAVAVTALNYAALTGYDALALRYARHPLPYRKIALASFIACAFSISLGHAVLTDGAVRYQLYTAWGVPAEAVAKVVAFCGLAFWVGYLSMGGVVLLAEPPAVPSGLPFSARTLGAVLVSLFAVWPAVNVARTEPVRLWRWSVDVPGCSRIAR